MRKENGYLLELDDTMIKFGFKGRGAQPKKLKEILIQNWITIDQLFEKIKNYFENGKVKNFQDLRKFLYEEMVKNSEKFNLNPEKKIYIYIQKLKKEEPKICHKTGKPIYNSSKIRISYFDKNGNRINTSLLAIILELLF